MTKCEKDERDRHSNVPVVIHDQFRGNRIIHRHFPVHYAKVVLARHMMDKYAKVKRD